MKDVVKQLRCQARKRAKAITAFVVPLAVGYAARAGLSLDPAVTIVLAGALTGFLVHQVPNRECA
jgi:hypothetical protein